MRALICSVLLACNHVDPGVEERACTQPFVAKIKGPRGGRVDWHPQGTEIAYDSRGLGTCYDVYTMAPNGTGSRCLTCNRSDVPSHTKGSPAYHPSGRYIVFQAEKQSHEGFYCTGSQPGMGVYDDLWILDRDLDRAYMIRAIPDGKEYGTLHPHFSHDGTKLLWSEMYAGPSSTPGFEVGRWKLMIADVAIDDGGTLGLANIRQLAPTADSGEGIFEAHGFTPDDRHAVFSGDPGYGTSVYSRNDIWTVDLATGVLDPITSDHYNEHGHFSPSGAHVALMSAEDLRFGTEWYLMNPDGSGRCQLSHLNFWNPTAVTSAADLSWAPDGTRFAGYAHILGNGAPEENIYIVDFGAPQ